MPSGQPPRILIIEDDPIDRRIYRACLSVPSEFPFELAESDSGEAGIETARSWRPECVLLDYDLPDMDGLEVVARLTNGSGAPACAVVMLTAYGDEALAVRAMKAGVMDYLPKRQASGSLLSRLIANAIERFRLQRQVEQQRCALEKSARRQEALLEAIPQMVWTSDGERRLEYANRRWLEYTGLDPQRAGVRYEDCLHAEDRERTLDAWNRAVESGSVFEIEHRLRRAGDGTYRWHLVRAVPMPNGEGPIAEWLGACTEVEEQKQAEKSAAQKDKLESISRLAGGIAHDLNNLLVAILGRASLAMETLPAGNAAREMLNEVVRAGELAAQLIRQMLAYAGKGNYILEQADPGPFLRQVCQRVRASLPPYITLEIEIGKGLPLVETDLSQMQQVFTNLLTNAIEAIGESPGSIWVSAGGVEIDEGARTGGVNPEEIAPGRYLSIEVRDTGCGMDEEIQAGMFDPFFSTKFMGRGLGLAAAQGFVRTNRGAIHVESAPGKGSRFQVLLPVVPEARRSPKSSPHENANGKLIQQTDCRLKSGGRDKPVSSR